MKKVKLNGGMCIGCGACAAICDEYFEIKGNISSLKKEEADETNNNLLEAIDACPVGAIIIEEN